MFMRTARQNQSVDPLYVIFEQHLYNFQDLDTDRKSFIGRVVQEYLAYLRRMNIAVPKSLEDSVSEELGVLVHTMLVKKIYGCLTISAYQKRVPPAARKRVHARYTRLAKLRKTG